MNWSRGLNGVSKGGRWTYAVLEYSALVAGHAAKKGGKAIGVPVMRAAGAASNRVPRLRVPTFSVPELKLPRPKLPRLKVPRLFVRAEGGSPWPDRATALVDEKLEGMAGKLLAIEERLASLERLAVRVPGRMLREKVPWLAEDRKGFLRQILEANKLLMDVELGVPLAAGREGRD